MGATADAIIFIAAPMMTMAIDRKSLDKTVNRVRQWVAQKHFELFPYEPFYTPRGRLFPVCHLKNLLSKNYRNQESEGAFMVR
jgi:hypothetical protein